MKKRSLALLASAVPAAGAAAAAVAAEPPLKTLPSQHDIWITGTIQRGNGPYASGDYTSLRLDRPSTSPRNEKVVTEIVLGKAGVPDRLLLPPWGSRSPAGARHLSGFRSPAYARRTSCFRSTDGSRGTSRADSKIRDAAGAFLRSAGDDLT